MSLPAFRALGCCLFIAISLIALGCGKKVNHVSGKVLYKGEPVPAGVIWFDPDASKKNDAPQGYAIIKNGEYSTAKENGQPVHGGGYIVRIEGFDGKQGNELPLGKPLFTNFQQSVDLPNSDTTLNFDVPEKK